MLHNFAFYNAPSASLLYSSAYFDKITFHDVAELSYLVIARKSSVTLIIRSTMTQGQLNSQPTKQFRTLMTFNQ